MTRPERPTVEEPATTNAEEEEPLPSFSEQLADQLGGWRGLIESSIPVTVFVIANIVLALRPAIIVAVSSGLLIAVFRLFRRQSVRHAVNGLFGIFVGAMIAWRSGDARDFYLPGIFISAGYALALILSAVFRYPLVGWIWSVVLDGGKTRWREDPVLRRAFSWLTVVWAAVYIAKVLIQYGLWQAHQDELLGVARIVLGWPPYAILLAVTVWSVRRVTRHQQPEAV